jgi:hypothetical protein
VLPEDLPLEIPPSVKADLATVLGHIAAGRRVELGVGELGHPETKVLDGAALLAAGAGEDNLRWYRMALVWYATMPLPLGRHATAISLSIHQDPELWRTWNELESWAEFRLGPATNPGLLDLEAAFTEHPDWVLGLPLRDYQAYLTERLAARRGQLPLEDHAGATLLAARRPLVTQAGRLLLHPAVDGRRAAGAFDDLALFGKPEALQAAAVPPPEELWAEADLRQAMAPASKLLASIIADREPDLHTRWLGLLSRLLDSPAELAVAPQPPTWLGSPAFAARRLSAALHGQALLSSRRPALPQHLSVLPTAQSFCNPSMGKFALAPAAARPDPTAEPLPAFYAAAAELALSLRQRLDTTQVPSEACDTSLWSFCEDPSEWLGRMASLFTILAQISTKQLNDDPLSDLERQQLREIQAFLAVQPTSPKGGQLQLRLLHRQGGAPVLLRGLIPALEAPGQTPPPWLRFFVLPPAAPTNPSQEP